MFTYFQSFKDTTFDNSFLSIRIIPPVSSNCILCCSFSWRAIRIRVRKVGQEGGFAIDQFVAGIGPKTDQPTLAGTLSPKGKPSIFPGSFSKGMVPRRNTCPGLPYGLRQAEEGDAYFFLGLSRAMANAWV